MSNSSVALATGLLRGTSVGRTCSAPPLDTSARRRSKGSDRGCPSVQDATRLPKAPRKLSGAGASAPRLLRLVSRPSSLPSQVRCQPVRTILGEARSYVPTAKTDPRFCRLMPPSGALERSRSGLSSATLGASRLGPSREQCPKEWLKRASHPRGGLPHY